MARSVRFEVLGLGELGKTLKNASERIVVLADNGVKMAGLFIEGEVKESIAGNRAEQRSVDTGRFLNSVKSSSSGKMQAEISSNVSYAEFLEYGTSRISARSHFRNTVQRNKDKVVNIVKAEVDKI